jgi:hypothetical protein
LALALVVLGVLEPLVGIPALLGTYEVMVRKHLERNVGVGVRRELRVIAG